MTTPTIGYSTLIAGIAVVSALASCGSSSDETTDAEGRGGASAGAAGSVSHAGGGKATAGSAGASTAGAGNAGSAGTAHEASGGNGGGSAGAGTGGAGTGGDENAAGASSGGAGGEAGGSGANTGGQGGSCACGSDQVKVRVVPPRALPSSCRCENDPCSGTELSCDCAAMLCGERTTCAITNPKEVSCFQQP